MLATINHVDKNGADPRLKKNQPPDILQLKKQAASRPQREKNEPGAAAPPSAPQDDRSGSHRVQGRRGGKSAVHARQQARQVVEDERELKKEFKHVRFLARKDLYKPISRIIDFRDRDPFVQRFSEICPPPLPDNVDLSRFEYVEPATPVQMNHLRLFDRQPREMPLKYKKSFDRAMAHVSELLALNKKLPMPKIKALESVHFGAFKFPGLEYARQGLRHRRDAHPVALKDAKQAWRDLMAGRWVQPHDARMGGKGKLMERKKNDYSVTNIDEESTAMGRLILMLSHRDFLLLGVLEKPLTRVYLDKRWPIHVGQGWYHGGSEEFINKLSKHHAYHCFDAKKFDTAIDGWLVLAAISILRKQYEDGMNPKYDGLWNFVYESLVFVVICRDDGIRMQKGCGTTSGNNFNTLVQSVVTLLLGYTALVECAQASHGTKGVDRILLESKVDVLGDDTVMALKKPWDSLSRDRIANVVSDCFNIDWSGKKSFSTDRLMDTSDPGASQFKGIQFLGMYFRHERCGRGRFALKIVIPYRPFQESYMSLLFPKHGRLTRQHAWLRAVSVYLNGAGNPDTRKWLEKYMDYLEEVPFSIPDRWPDFFRDHSMRKFLHHHEKKYPKPLRITYPEWIQMVCHARKDEDQLSYS